MPDFVEEAFFFVEVFAADDFADDVFFFAAPLEFELDLALDFFADEEGFVDDLLCDDASSESSPDVAADSFGVF